MISGSIYLVLHLHLHFLLCWAMLCYAMLQGGHTTVKVENGDGDGDGGQKGVVMSLWGE